MIHSRDTAHRFRVSHPGRVSQVRTTGLRNGHIPRNGGGHVVMEEQVLQDYFDVTLLMVLVQMNR